jgi:uncharacterized protein (DUF58 family)
MALRFIPGQGLLAALAAAIAAVAAALLYGIAVADVAVLAIACACALALASTLDYVLSRRAWRAAAPILRRQLPAAFAIGAQRPIALTLELGAVAEPRTWRITLHDHADASLQTQGLPMRLEIAQGTRLEAAYTVIPTRRGEVSFNAADTRVRSRWGLCEMLEKLGEQQVRRVYPDFAQIARYAWLAGDRRLQEIGIKTYRRRGEGTDFEQLAEYRPGDPVRHIDWKATLRFEKPILREFQDERDQNVMLLVDCGRRMRADDRMQAAGTAHFDQVLNAIMLLAYVALQHGDAVGALTFGTPPGEERASPPRKGVLALNALMGQLYGVQPTLAHSDYVAAAQALLRRQPKRSLVIVITNFRDEDSDELAQALRLLRSRHLVLLASLRERIVRELAEQPLISAEATLEAASAHLHEQSRRDAFNRLAARDALMVDAEPERLGIELVNRYHAVKRAGLI